MKRAQETGSEGAVRHSSGAHMRAVDALTPQQARVLKHLGEGMPNKVIAAELNISEATVKAHMSVILRTLKCQNRTQAALVGLCVRFGLPIEHVLGGCNSASELAPAATQKRV